ncbi:translation initiation factor eIF3 subunit g [Tilletia horrida]|uniref:Eukaryotic translation initiation factor 3 subunit G n=1 Tax=Tilletia horrida TaxID=155126 RepID=A0AAN6JTU5_9BASI|nr:translation initiation factor eIF3 subunit g [Tilletia horrida]KAK0557376.1 translation initiation factor eIF3 subunit g [Tilletia horrida]
MAPVPSTGTAGPNPGRLMNWADDVDEDVSTSEQPRIIERDEGNGVKVVIEHTTNADGKRVKITRRTRRTLIKTKVNAEVAERKQWAKFGQEKGRPAGPHSSTTTVGENIQIKLNVGGAKRDEPEPDALDNVRAQLANKRIVCRLCKGDHFTTKCPYKDTLEGIPGATDAAADADGNFLPDKDADPTNPAVAAAAGGGTGKYVPPSMRAGANRGAGERMGGPGLGNRDDLPTLRVTNLTEEAEEDDLRELFSRFGRVTRVFLGRDRETGACKGYAFVTFEIREEADRARQKVDGMGYDNLILGVQWSAPRA